MVKTKDDKKYPINNIFNTKKHRQASIQCKRQFFKLNKFNLMENLT